MATINRLFRDPPFKAPKQTGTFRIAEDGLKTAKPSLLTTAGRPGHAGTWLGELAVFVAAFSGAACAVLYRPYLRRYPVLPVSAFGLTTCETVLEVLAAKVHPVDAGV